MKLNTILSLCMLAICTSCSGQKTSSIATTTESELKTSEIQGDTVSTISDSIWVIFQDRDNNYWFGSNGEGVFRYDQKTIIRFTSRHGLSNDSIREIQQDKEGNIYFSTMNGICKFDGHTIRQLNPIKPADTHSGWKLEPDDLWFKGNSIVNGPYRFDGHSLYDLDFPKHEMEDELIARTGIVPWSNYGVYTIYKDRKGNIWFGTSCFGACRFDGESLTWISEREITYLTDAFGVRGIIEDHDGWMWLTNTIFKYVIIENKTGESDPSAITYEKEKGAGNGQCDYFQYIVRDDAGDYWMSTYTGGVWRYSPTIAKWTHYPVLLGDTNVALVSLYKDKKNALWLGTQENGVYLFNSNSFEKFEF